MEAATICTASASGIGTRLPETWKPAEHRRGFGRVVLLIFLLTQCFDGVLTYMGVTRFGIAAEANPIMGALMIGLGKEAALIGAKSVAAGLGIYLYLRQVHAAVALLAGFYLMAAIFPWMNVLC